MATSTTTTTKIPAKPKFCVGDVVANHLFIGTIESGFFVDGHWMYSIGDNASAVYDPTGYKVGPKCVAESSILWVRNDATKTWKNA